MSNKPALPKRSPPSKGHVETFRVSDEMYYQVFLDGEYIDFIGRATLREEMNTGFRRRLAARAGVPVEDLRYSHSSPVWHGMEMGLEIEDYTYEDMVKWRDTHANNFDFWVLDLEELEEQFLLNNP